MSPIHKLNDGGESIRAERYQRSQKVGKRDDQDKGNEQRQFHELVEGFGTDEDRKKDEKRKSADSIEISKGESENSGSDNLEQLQRKASYRDKKIENNEDVEQEIGGKVDIDV